MTDEFGGPKSLTGPFNVYRSKGNERMWMKFEEMAYREGLGRSRMLERIVRLWLDKNYVAPGPHNVNPPDNT